ncbi:phage tail tape measure protein, TP901 family [Dethiosulfovibrio peptidovorans DSM 11002]|uniref:Phage tail tape measure protein, TP901 family n=1 Tax=Dethiosulfovibrio peptidovorans DSM 11002 TaxID=469381 RepID=D2Z3R4_9BACT|nr:phage tail tape measure protein [Dethiosulfovibrio peptidovorans]EFC90370.1 phage tail tape measure protein, TP901 family [Dethiosulfovibrio peptidovorans DSM 11002]
MSKRDVQINVGARVDQAVSAFDRLQKTLYLNGHRLETYGQSVGKVFDPAMKGLVAVGLAAKTAAAGTGLAAFSVAQDLEEAMAVVAQKTGEGEEALKEYEDIVRRLFRENPVSGYGEVAQALAAVRVATGAAGEALEKLTQQYLSLSDVTGVDLNNAVRLGSRLFGDWSISTDKQTEALDALFVASRSTGASIENLAEKAVTYGTKFRQLGFSLEEALGLLGKWEKEGVSTEKALSGLGQAITNMTRSGVRNLVQGWKDLTNSIKNATTEGDAINKAVKYFGADAGPDMAAAIRENRFELGALVEVLSKAEGAIETADEETSTLIESLQSLRNTAKDKLLEPLGDEVSRYVAHVAELLEVLVEWADENQVLKGSVDAFFEGLGLGNIQVEEFKEALEKVDVASFTDQCETFGRMLKAIYRSLKTIADMIPWELLIEHADSLTKIIIYGWASGKVLSIAGGVLSLAGSFGDLADMMEKFNKVAAFIEGTSIAKWLIKSGAALSEMINKLGDSGRLSRWAKDFRNEMRALIKYKGAWFYELKLALGGAGANIGLDMGLEDLEGFEEALKGDKEALESLPEPIQKWIEKNKKTSVSLKETSKAVEDLDDKIKNVSDDMKKLEEDPFSLASLFDDEELFDNPDDLLARWVSDKPIRKIDLAISDLKKRVVEIKAGGKEAMETLGVSAEEADAVMRDSILKAVEEIKKSLADEDPYMATAFVSAMEKMGTEGGDALMASIAGAMGKGQDSIVKILTGAIQDGFIKGPALTEAMKLIQKKTDELVKKTGDQIEKEYAGMKFSSALMGDLKAYHAKLELSNLGVQSRMPKFSGKGEFGGTVNKVSAPISIQIGTVNVKRPEDADKTGREIGRGIVKSFDLGY